jgi:F-type H+-transporting ATPase subunit delta
MNLNRITVRYAKALLESAVELNIAQIVNDDIKLISKTSEFKDFKLFLENPTIQTSRKNKIISEIFQNKINQLTLNFLFLLTKNKREIYLSSITRNFLKQYRDLFGITHVLLTTTTQAEDLFLKEIEKNISTLYKTKVELHDKADESLLGGFIVNINDVQYDASVKNKLEKIKRELLA